MWSSGGSGGRLRVPFVAVVGGHGRRRRAYEYRSARVLEQVLQQRHFDRSSAAADDTTVVVVVIVVDVVVVVLVMVVVQVLRLRLLRRHRALTRRTVRQVVRYEFFRLRVDVRCPPDAYPGGRQLHVGLRVLLQL